MNFSFLPADIRYYDYFEQASANLIEISIALLRLLENYDHVEDQTRQITELEHKGDSIVHEVTTLLPRTLITPIDLEDILRLISAVDDAVDAVEDVARRLVIYQIKEIKKPAGRLAQMIVEGSKELDTAIKELRSKKQFNKVRECIVQINTLENNADLVLDESLSDLVQNNQDVFDFIRWKEIFELLEATTDRIEDASDVLLRVIIAND
jgi:predicted phosphate transport protein (TIGR00153 family)